MPIRNLVIVLRFALQIPPYYTIHLIVLIVFIFRLNIYISVHVTSRIEYIITNNNYNGFIRAAYSSLWFLKCVVWDVRFCNWANVCHPWKCKAFSNDSWSYEQLMLLIYYYLNMCIIMCSLKVYNLVLFFVELRLIAFFNANYLLCQSTLLMRETIETVPSLVSGTLHLVTGKGVKFNRNIFVFLCWFVGF